MNDLRDRLARRCYRERWIQDEEAAYYEIVDVILAEIGRTHVLAERQRLASIRERYELAACFVHDRGTVRAWESDDQVLRSWLGV